MRSTLQVWSLSKLWFQNVNIFLCSDVSFGKHYETWSIMIVLLFSWPVAMKLMWNMPTPLGTYGMVDSWLLSKQNSDAHSAIFSGQIIIEESPNDLMQRYNIWNFNDLVLSISVAELKQFQVVDLSHVVFPTLELFFINLGRCRSSSNQRQYFDKIWWIRCDPFHGKR